MTFLRNCSTDECSGITVTSNFDYANLSDECALTGSITATYTIEDECGNKTTQTATFTVIDTSAPEVGCDPDPLTIDCVGAVGNEEAASQWNQENINKLNSCIADNCSTANFEVTSNYDFANLAGDCGTTGSIEVIYTIKDECGNETTKSAILTIIDETPPVVNCEPNNMTIDCAGEAENLINATDWNNNNIDKLKDCSNDACSGIEVSSNFDFNQLTDECGFTGGLEVIYTISDACGNEITKTATLTIIDTIPPVATCEPITTTIECLGDVQNKVEAADWDATNISNLKDCASDLCGTVTVSSNFDYANITLDCGVTGSITVIYTITDECLNSIIKEATLIIVDTKAPVVSW